MALPSKVVDMVEYAEEIKIKQKKKKIIAEKTQEEKLQAATNQARYGIGMAMQHEKRLDAISDILNDLKSYLMDRIDDQDERILEILNKLDEKNP